MRSSTRRIRDGKDDEVGGQLRLRVYGLDEKGLMIQQGGAIVKVNSYTEWDHLKVILSRSSFGHDPRLPTYTYIQVFLLPDGEEAHTTDDLCNNDKIGVYVGHEQLPAIQVAEMNAMPPHLGSMTDLRRAKSTDRLIASLLEATASADERSAGEPSGAGGGAGGGSGLKRTASNGASMTADQRIRMARHLSFKLSAKDKASMVGGGGRLRRRLGSVSKSEVEPIYEKHDSDDDFGPVSGTVGRTMKLADLGSSDFGGTLVDSPKNSTILAELEKRRRSLSERSRASSRTESVRRVSVGGLGGGGIHSRAEIEARRQSIEASLSGAAPALPPPDEHPKIESDSKHSMDAIAATVVGQQAKKSRITSEIARKRWKHAFEQVVLLRRMTRAAKAAKDVGASVRIPHEKKRKLRAVRSMDAFVKDQFDIYQHTQDRNRVDEKLPWHVIHPDGIFRIVWDTMTLLLVVFFGFAVPYRIGFDVTLNQAETVFELIADVIFMVDICLNFRTAYRVDGVLVSKTWPMTYNYLTSWFLIDLLASFPLAYVTDTGGGVNRLLRMLRMAKLMRMLRLLKLFPRLFQMLETSIKFNPSIIRFLRSFAIMFMIWHWVACAYWFVAREEYGGYGSCLDASGTERRCFVNHCLCGTTDRTDVTIISGTDMSFRDVNNPNMWLPLPHWADEEPIFQYSQGLFWAVEVTVGIGDDISPVTSTEVWFTTSMVVLGLMMYSVIIGSASSALSNMDATAAHRRQTLDGVTSYMRSRKVPRFFQRIIIDYYEHMWSSPSGVQEEEVFADLPTGLRRRLAMVINRDLVMRIPVFQTLGSRTYMKLIERLHHNTFLPGESIIKQGSSGRNMYFIKRGRVDALLPNGVVYDTYRPGQFFGEGSLLTNANRDSSFRAVDFVDVLTMNQGDFMELEVSTPAFALAVYREYETRQRKRLSVEVAAAKGEMKAVAKVLSADNLFSDEDHVVEVSPVEIKRTRSGARRSMNPPHSASVVKDVYGSRRSHLGTSSSLNSETKSAARPQPGFERGISHASHASHTSHGSRISELPKPQVHPASSVGPKFGGSGGGSGGGQGGRSSRGSSRGSGGSSGSGSPHGVDAGRGSGAGRGPGSSGDSPGLYSSEPMAASAPSSSPTPSPAPTASATSAPGPSTGGATDGVGDDPDAPDAPAKRRRWSNHITGKKKAPGSPLFRLDKSVELDDMDVGDMGPFSGGDKASSARRASAPDPSDASAIPGTISSPPHGAPTDAF